MISYRACNLRADMNRRAGSGFAQACMSAGLGYFFG